MNLEFDQFLKPELLPCPRVVLATGGSIMGGKVLGEIIENSKEKIVFLDDVRFSAFYDILRKYDNPFFISISKSGVTLETWIQTLFFWQKFPFPERWTVISMADSPMESWAKGLGIKFLQHPDNLSGRFSIFALPGLFPVADLIKIEQLKKGVLAADAKIAQRDFEFIIMPQKSVHVIWIYHPKLLNFARWYAQLLAESLGKVGQGICPQIVLGPEDQHSQLQLYLAGPRDKIFSFFYLADSRAEEILPEAEFWPENFSFDQFLLANFHGIAETVAQKHPTRIFNIEKYSEEVIGELCNTLMQEVVLAAQKLEINPFDQPEVEAGKKKVRDKIFQK